MSSSATCAAVTVQLARSMSYLLALLSALAVRLAVLMISLALCAALTVQLASPVGYLLALLSALAALLAGPMSSLISYLDKFQ